MARSDSPPFPTPGSGVALGGRGGLENELLEDGQEEVFSRTEVESGRIEHQSGAGSGLSPAPAIRDSTKGIP